MRRSTWPTMAIHGMPATGLPTILGSITPSGRIRPSTTAVPPICIWGRVAGGVNRLFRRGRGTATPAGVAVPRPRLPTKCQAFHQGDRRHPHGKLAQKLCLTLGPPYGLTFYSNSVELIIITLHTTSAISRAEANWSYTDRKRVC